MGGQAEVICLPVAPICVVKEVSMKPLWKILAAYDSACVEGC